MLDDRKFFHPVDSNPLPALKRRGPPMAPPNKWTPVGPDSAVTMDNAASYVGEHSPVVHLTGSQPRGIAQSGLSLAGGKSYAGRIVVAADAGARIFATLIWGAGEGQRQTVDVSATGDWATVPIAFICAADTVEGRLEIVGRGTGTFPRRRRVADACGQYPWLSRRYHGADEGDELQDTPHAGRQLRLWLRLEIHNRRSGQAPADSRPGLGRRAAERCRRRRTFADVQAPSASNPIGA